MNRTANTPIPNSFVIDAQDVFVYIKRCGCHLEQTPTTVQLTICKASTFLCREWTAMAWLHLVQSSSVIIVQSLPAIRFFGFSYGIFNLKNILLYSESCHCSPQTLGTHWPSSHPKQQWNHDEFSWFGNSDTLTFMCWIVLYPSSIDHRCIAVTHNIKSNLNANSLERVFLWSWYIRSNQFVLCNSPLRWLRSCY